MAKEKKMRYWSVAWHVDATGHQCIMAATAEEAQALSESEFCADQDNTEIGDAQEVVSVDEITKEQYTRYSR